AGSSAFDGWTGCDSVSGNQCTVNVDGAEEVTAAFKLLQRHLTVQTAGDGDGTVTGTGIDCGGDVADCEQDFDHGTSVTLTANPAQHSDLASWTGCNSTSGDQCTLAMTGARTVTATFALDSVAPDTTITTRPANVTRSTEATFEFVSTEAGTFECSLDGAPFTGCTSPQSYPAVTEGSHEFKVRAIDPVGNVDASPASDQWTVDLTAPDSSISAGPSGTVASKEATFSFTSNETGSTFECSLDGAAFASCSSPQSYTGLADGGHTFEVRATDVAGNLEGSPAQRSWSVDTTAPETTIVSGPSGTTTSSQATFTFTSEAGAEFACSLDGEAFSACKSPKTYTGLAEGQHAFKVRATDALGNTEATPAERVWTIDIGRPETTLDSGPSGTTGSTEATFAFSSNEAGSTFECSLDGGAFASCSSPKSYTGLAEGAHTFGVRATDLFGNVDTSPAERSWTIDLTAPETTLVAGPSGPTASTEATFEFSSADEGATFECSLDGGAFASCTSPTTLTALAEGSHTFRVRATDLVFKLY
ncbi:MAG: hypothetical protein M3271_03940, partial [Actinomycetota bacterium]|nr:hypothetical protein [Actinomycetota bacterium]